ncbi:Gfo/Idh/MocA family oxidoreductase [Flavitalea sp. BT771]|uniref:Gfo/Idh/MocA family protein n=1 Tax=Flavitalea sp. BT771 TaxID=3063329 RepID=UPI0026E46001|nr:Gfo/Idh/MocA family oxidoreductase [Flavitalea sp. BT771]MDO6430498.1 Gfo/Idh/MocA family oxidoreductase [Flavitalea sp. BT771]MDV6219362.1 Gfo/Idh/MocA family oxidoreductase [Flavitalea sp. BT771]
MKRNEFLRKGLMAAAGFYIVPRHVLGKGFIAPSDRLSVAAIGVGGKGEVDVNYISGSGKADIAFLCDVDDRRAATIRNKFPAAKYYRDYRELLDKEHKHIDAVSISTPDHMHAVIGMASMQLGKHVYIQKPLTHDIYEARMLTQAATRYKVVTQMGNQGASGDGVRQLVDWYRAGILGDITEVYCFTNRPVWPQGIQWSDKKAPVPAGLDWNLWLGTAPYRDYVDNLVPFNWRGWWDYGTGALGDMGCHIIAPAFQVLELGYPTEAECSVGSVYVGEFSRGYFPDSCPPSSHITLKFKGAAGKPDVKLHWMDGGIQPERPDELGPNEIFGDGDNATYFIGTKGKMMCATYGQNPQLLPTSRTAQTTVPQTIARVPGADREGHYNAWVEACLAGYGSDKEKNLSSNFKVAGPLTESVLMGNLAIRAYDIRHPRANNGFDYPGRHIKLLWDGTNMKITNFDEANQFVRRTYRQGWSL